MMAKKVKVLHMKFIKHHGHTSILIAGCGRLGSCMASSLSQEGFDVTMIDKDEKAFRRLRETFSGFQVIGDASDLDMLRSCGIANADIVVVATDSDNVNCMIAQIANMIFHIQQVYIRLNDPDKEELLKDTNIQAIYPAKLSMQEFIRISHIQLKEMYA